MRLKVFRQEATDDQVLLALQFVRDDLAPGKLLAIHNLNSATIQVAIGIPQRRNPNSPCRVIETDRFASWLGLRSIE